LAIVRDYLGWGCHTTFVESSFSQKVEEENKATRGAAGFELVAFENQLPTRAQVPMATPMRFESQMPTPTKSGQRADTCLHQQQQHFPGQRSDAARQVANAALPPCVAPSSESLLRRLAPPPGGLNGSGCGATSVRAQVGWVCWATCPRQPNIS
jgi:hypothetical protein